MAFLKHLAALIILAVSQTLPSAHVSTTAPKTTPTVISHTQEKATSTASSTKSKVSPIKKGAPLPPPTFGTSTPTTQQKSTPSAPTSEPTTQTIQTPAPDYEKINEFTRQAVVNILCITSRNQEISGTGVIIDSRGTILTNAHLGQYFLLKDYPSPHSTECYIRTGSPARSKYIPELMYISPSWVQNNKTIMKQTDPRGTGQYDFAFLRIVSRTDGSPLPDSFPHVAPEAAPEILKNEPVVLVSYPAGFLGGQSIDQGLYLTSAITTIRDYYTFTSDSIDLISVPGTVISQRGSSGGAVVDGKQSLIGLITTSSEATTTSARELNAITMGHINRTLKSEIGLSLSEFIAQNPADAARSFQANTASDLAKLITDELK